MKVILRKGNIPAQNKYFMKCHNCGCQYTFEKSDVKSYPDYQENVIYWVKCPFCNQKNHTFHLRKYRDMGAMFAHLLKDMPFTPFQKCENIKKIKF